MTTLKLQYEFYEEGEFTDEESVNYNSIKSIFEEKTEIIKTKSSFTINEPYTKFYIRNNNNYLKISHFAKDAFTVEYSNVIDNRFHSGNFYKKSIMPIIELFCNQNYLELNKIIPSTNKNVSELIKSYIAKDFTYHFSHKGIIWLLINCIITVALNIYIIGLILSKPILFILIIPSIFSVMLIMHFFLHINHITKSKNSSIRISSGCPKIVYMNNSNKKEFDKSEILKVINYSGFPTKNPFANYSFTRVFLKDNSSIEIGYMIIDGYDLRYKLRKINFEIKYVFYPYIKNYCP